MSGTVAVLAGGLSLEREVSLRSGSRVADALTAMGWDVERLDLDHGLVSRLTETPPSAVFLALHGQSGEDGTVQSLLEMLGVPYTGPDPSASALVWDKPVFKGVAHRGGIHTPPWVTITADAIRDLGVARIFGRLDAALGDEKVVKPAKGGAGMGVQLATGPSELTDALLAALSYDNAVVIERHIAGTEVAVAILDGQPLPPVEVVPRDGRYDFAARYTHGATDLFAPARLPEPVLERCQAAAMAAWSLSGCRDMARADFIVDEAGQPWLLEVDTCPGMTNTSLLPMAVDAAGLTFEAFCNQLVEMAIARGPLGDRFAAGGSG